MPFRSSRRASWPLQDVSGDVIALCDLGGTNASARIITQLVYDAYGNVIGRDDDPANPSTGPPAPELRVGHKGLFFDRLDAGISDPLTGSETPRLEAGAKLSGHVRNRTLHCGLGRWNQRDPNMTGLVVQSGGGVVAHHGVSLTGEAQTLDLGEHYASGANVYQYAASNTFSYGDPTGLFEFSMGGLLGASASAAEMRADSMESSIESGLSMGDWVMGPIASYAMDQFLDYHWASNWDEPDDLYRGSAGWSAGTGSWEFSGKGGSDSGYSQLLAGNWVENIKGQMNTRATGMGVYIVLDDKGDVIYAGRTKDLQTRMKVQKIAKGGAMVIGISVNSPDAVRALEDLMIRYHQQRGQAGLNKINGIHINNKDRKPFYKEFKKALGHLM